MVVGGNCWNHTSCAGDGTDGDMPNINQSFSVNDCFTVTAMNAAGTQASVNESSYFQPQRRALLVVRQSSRQPQSNLSSLDPASLGNVGRWHIARVTSVEPVNNVVTLSPAAPWDVNDAMGEDFVQLCTVPQYRNVSFEQNSSMFVQPYSPESLMGYTSGLMAFFVSGDLYLNDSTIYGLGAGLRAGYDTSANDTCELQNAGPVGEGMGLSYGSSSTTRNTLGGAGGAPGRGGGGGGGHLGQGGVGGTGTCAGNAEGGAETEPQDRLLLGGGGGGGPLGGTGGAGGGIVMIFARTLRSGGTIDVSGAEGSDAFDGAGGGGGAGGTAIFWAQSQFAYLNVLVRGGDGGDVQGSAAPGPGGGGGGGRAWIHKAGDLVCLDNGGAAGRDDSNSTHSATPGQQGLCSVAN
ncbi:MAG: hypothetical protein AB2A00_42245 [Myxococcota bacterium]